MHTNFKNLRSMKRFLRIHHHVPSFVINDIWKIIGKIRVKSSLALRGELEERVWSVTVASCLLGRQLALQRPHRAQQPLLKCNVKYIAICQDRIQLFIKQLSCILHFAII